MRKFMWFAFIMTIEFFNICECEKLQRDRREKRQLFYKDITFKPQTFRSRADEKDETDRTGHLPLEAHYPSPEFNENYEGELVGSVPHFPEVVSYDNKHHETKPSFSKPSIFSAPLFEKHEELHYKPKPIHEEPHYKPKPIHEAPHYNPKPTHEVPHHNPKPIHEAPHYKPKPTHEVPHYNPKPIHEASHYKPKPIHEAPHYNPKPIHEAPHYKPNRVHDVPIYKPKPVHVEPYYTSRPNYQEENDKPIPSYEVSGHHDVKNRPHKTKNSIPGIAGKDYPIYNSVPYTSFSCADVPHKPGMYANPEAGCQAYHVCHDDRHGPQGASFLCTNGTLFNQESFSCDWWYNVDCNQARSYYGLNSDPHHNPYSQKPYFEDPSHHFNDGIVHSDIYESSFRASNTNEQNKKVFNPITNHSERKTKLSRPNVDIEQPQPIKNKATKQKVSKPVVTETKKSHFNIETNHGSFFTPFSFDNEGQAPVFPTKRENKITQETYSEPSKRQTILQTMNTRGKPNQTDQSNLEIQSKSLSESTKRIHQILDQPAFPESKDIYSRVVANQRRTKDPQFTKPQVSKRLHKDETTVPISVLKEEIRNDHSAFEDLNFEWGEKI